MKNLKTHLQKAITVRRKLNRTGRSGYDLRQLTENVAYWVATSENVLNTAVKKQVEILMVLPPNFRNKFKEMIKYENSKIKTVSSNYEIIDYPEVINFFYLLDKKHAIDIDDSLKFVFDYFDELLLNDKFNLCNKILNSIKVNNYHVDILIGILTITFSWKNQLNLRSEFYNRLKVHLSKILKTSEVKEILVGLE